MLVSKWAFAVDLRVPLTSNLYEGVLSLIPTPPPATTVTISCVLFATVKTFVVSVAESPFTFNVSDADVVASEVKLTKGIVWATLE